LLRFFLFFFLVAIVAVYHRTRIFVTIRQGSSH